MPDELELLELEDELLLEEELLDELEEDELEDELDGPPVFPVEELELLDDELLLELELLELEEELELDEELLELEDPFPPPGGQASPGHHSLPALTACVIYAVSWSVCSGVRLPPGGINSPI